MAKKPIGPRKPWHPAPYDDVAIPAAFKALEAGVANDGQQKMLLKWIVYDLCQTYDQPYQPESDRDTVFGCAKQFVGQQIVKMLKIVPVKKP